MDELMKRLLENEVLSEEVRAELTEEVEKFKQSIREEVTGEVRSELSAQWISERDELVSKVDSFVAEALTHEMTDLHSDIERFRDLEVEYAEKLVEERHKMAGEVAEELDGLVDKIDAFFEMRLAAEMEELKEDLEIVKQNEFGRKMFETFAKTYAESYVDEDSVQSKLVVAESKLADAEAQLSILEDEKSKMVREAKMEQVLSPLTGKKREQMAMVLKNVDTARLEESYKFFIGRVLKEDQEEVRKPLNESKTRTRLFTGDTEEETPELPPVNEQLIEMKRLAGL